MVVDSHLRVDGNLLGHNLVNRILDELTIYNAEKDVARRMKRWGWEELPDDFLLGSLDGDTLVMPRGYAFQLKTLLRQKDLRTQWVDRRKWKRGEPFAKYDGNFPFKPHQSVAMRKIVRHQQGMYEAPTGSGKTVTCLGFLNHKQPQRTIILVDKLDLLNQWRKEIVRWLGIPMVDVGMIGGGWWKEGARVTVATVQTIRERLPDDDWFATWDCVILDECHHVSAETIQAIVGGFNAKYRFGVSATPDRKNDKFEFALDVLGEVFYQDDEEELRDSGVLMRPLVRVIKTDFNHVYWNDHHSDEDHECHVPGCKLSGQRPHEHRNNYTQVKRALIDDKARNNLVIAAIKGEVIKGNHHHLIISDEIKHLEALEAALDRSVRLVKGMPEVFVMTGQVRGDKRVQMKEAIEEADAAIIFATVAKEGLDIPKVDRIYLPFPASNPAKVQQWIGRGTRIAEGKTDIIVFDFFDYNVGIMRSQFRKRRFKCYDKLGMEVDLGVAA